MLKYNKDGQEVKCGAIYKRGRVGQAVVLTFVTLGKDHPLARYAQPHVFTINGEEDGCYLLLDGNGRTILAKESDGQWLCDATEWVQWEAGRQTEKIRRKNNRIALLEAHLELLKGVLVRQGVRVVSAEEAAKLGIE